MSKEHFIAAHEQLAEEFLRDNPWASWQQAYDCTADAAWDRMRDNWADRIDEARQRRKDAGI